MRLNFSKGVFMKNDIEVRKERRPQNSYSFFPEFADFFGDFPALSRKLTTNVREENDAFILSADLPGVSKEDIDVQVSANTLTIHAEHEEDNSYRSYHQSFTLPSNVDAEQVEASCENGRLEIFLPKNESAQKRKIEIQSGKGGFQERRKTQDQKQDAMKSKADEKH
jgi:HSP20 family protein